MRYTWKSKGTSRMGFKEHEGVVHGEGDDQGFLSDEPHCSHTDKWRTDSEEDFTRLQRSTLLLYHQYWLTYCAKGGREDGWIVDITSLPISSRFCCFCPGWFVPHLCTSTQVSTRPHSWLVIAYVKWEWLLRATLYVNHEPRSRVGEDTFKMYLRYDTKIHRPSTSKIHKILSFKEVSKIRYRYKIQILLQGSGYIRSIGPL